MIVQVATAKELVAAFKAAGAGDTISLAPGVYSDVALKSGQFSTPVTITSADPGNPAVLVDLEVTSVKGLIIQYVSIQADDKVGLSIAYSNSVVVSHVDVSGTSTERLEGSGLKMKNSMNVEVRDSSFHDIGYGITHVDSKYITISGNHLENIRTDGIRGGGTSFLEISNNSLSNFHRDPGEHGDAIQFWTRNTAEAAHDIVVKDNLIVRGESGGLIQGIFFGDETRGKMPYTNVTISGNTILGATYNGIDLYPAKHAVVTGNVVVAYEDINSSIRIDGSTDVVMSNNIATNYSIPATGNIGLVRTDNTVATAVPVGGDAAYIEQYYTRLHLPYVAPPVDNPVGGFDLGSLTNMTFDHAQSAPAIDVAAWNAGGDGWAFN